MGGMDSDSGCTCTVHPQNSSLASLMDHSDQTNLGGCFAMIFLLWAALSPLKTWHQAQVLTTHQEDKVLAGQAVEMSEVVS